ncbi:MAG: hypothetical protein ACMG6H_01430 [Acidobacteriota bacterium]
MKRLSAALLGLLAFAWAIDGFQAGDWIQFAPPGGGFSVMMPAKPQEEVTPREDFTSHFFRVTTPNVFYEAGYVDYAPSFRLDAAQELEANRDSFLKTINAKLIDSKKITLDGRSGIEFTADGNQASIKSRIYLFGSRMFQITVASGKGRDESDNVNRFLASFAFTKP